MPPIAFRGEPLRLLRVGMKVKDTRNGRVYEVEHVNIKGNAATVLMGGVAMPGCLDLRDFRPGELEEVS